MQCAACPVDVGECPRCGTFWFRRGGEKRYGVRPVEKCDPLVRPDGKWARFEEMSNVTVEEPWWPRG
jgi:hypothetical protein